MRRTLLAAAVLLSFLSCRQQETTFQNPVIQTDLADPSVIRVGKSWYAVGSSYNWGPEYPIYKSEDLVNWARVGQVFDIKPDWVSNGFWAPELFEHNGRYWCIYSAGRASDGKHCLGAAVADSPEGPYIDKGVILDRGTEQIDAYVFDDDGQLYISWKAHGLDKCPDETACARLSDDCLTVDEEEFTIVRDDEHIGMEGQCMFKRDGWYYLLYSSRSCCGPRSNYEVCLARSKSITGEWEKCPRNPILSGGTDEVKSLGHGTVTETRDGRLFYLCHAYLQGELYYMGRRPFLSELESTPDGWIACKSGPKALVTQKTPFKRTKQTIKDAFEDDFPGKDISWSYPADTGAINVICQTPFKPDYTVTATLKEGADGGLVFFGSYSEYISLEKKDGMIVLRSVFRDHTEDLACTAAPEGDIALSASVTDAVNSSFFVGAEAIAGEVSLERLMRWDSSFRIGILSAQDKPETCFRHFSIK